MNPFTNIKIFFYAFCMFMPLFWGCSSNDKLSRAKAEEIIKNSTQFPKFESDWIHNTYTMNTSGQVSEGGSGGGQKIKEMHDFFMQKKTDDCCKKLEPC